MFAVEGLTRRVGHPKNPPAGFSGFSFSGETGGFFMLWDLTVAGYLQSDRHTEFS